MVLSFFFELVPFIAIKHLYWICILQPLEVLTSGMYILVEGYYFEILIHGELCRNFGKLWKHDLGP